MAAILSWPQCVNKFLIQRSSNSFTCSLACSLTRSLTHSLTNPLIHSLTHSTHSLTHLHIAPVYQLLKYKNWLYMYFNNHGEKLINLMIYIYLTSQYFIYKITWIYYQKYWALLWLPVILDRPNHNTCTGHFTVMISWAGVQKLTHWGLVTPYGIGDLGQHWFR